MIRRHLVRALHVTLSSSLALLVAGVANGCAADATDGAATEDALSVFQRPMLAHPELDATVAVNATYLIDVTPAIIDDARAQGYRLFKLESTSATPAQFTALFVKNTGAYAESGGSWQYDLTAAQVAAIAADPATRVIDVCPYVSGATVLYAVVTIANTGRQKKVYEVLTSAASIDDVAQQATAFGGRVVDLNRVDVPLGDCGRVIGCVQDSAPLFTAVLIKNVGIDHRDQTIATGTITDIRDAIVAKDGAGKPVRVVAIDRADDTLLHYVLESRPASAWGWTYEGLVQASADSVDGLEHVRRRLGARFIGLRRYSTAQGFRFVALLADDGPHPVTGTSVSQATFQPLDDAMERALKKWGVAGGALAVVKDGRLVHAKGIGWSDVAAGRAATPDTLFRIASVSKTITATGILRLIQDGATLPNGTPLTLDTHPWGDLWAAGSGPTAGLNAITIRHLLEHTSGLYSTVKDPSLQYPDLSWIGSPTTALNHPAPVQATPGTRYLYLNGEYHLLTLVIEAITNLPYASWVNAKFFEPLGIQRIAIGGTVGAPYVESGYFDQPVSAMRYGRDGSDSATWALTPSYRYGASSWAASPIDLLRWACSVDGRRSGPRAIDAASFDSIYSQADAVALTSYMQQGLGFDTSKGADGVRHWHGGYLAGSTSSGLAMFPNGASIAWVVNGDSYPLLQISTDLWNDLTWVKVPAITSWPAGDLFPSYGFPAWSLVPPGGGAQ